MSSDLSDAIEWFQKEAAVGVIPTDTVYGLAALAKDKEAVKRLYSLKNRDNKPGTLIAANIEQLIDLGLKKRYLSAVDHYWPGAISVIIPCDNKLNYLHLGKFGIATRVPDNEKLRNLLIKVGPLLTSSANRPGKIPATNIKMAQQYFRNQVDFYIDGGDMNNNLPSTIIRVIDDVVEVIRQGAVRINS